MKDVIRCGKVTRCGSYLVILVVLSVLLMQAGGFVRAASVEVQGTVNCKQTVTGSEKVGNGDFSNSTGWTCYGGWQITGGVARLSAGTTSLLYKDISVSAGKTYLLTWQLCGNAYATQITPGLGGVTGTTKISQGTYSEFITAVSSGNLQFSSSSCAGDYTTIDNVTVYEWLPSLKVDGNMLLGSATSVLGPITDDSGAKLTVGGVWTNACSQDYKMAITNVPASGSTALTGISNLVIPNRVVRRGAWELLDSMRVVDYEYKKHEKGIMTRDGHALTMKETEAEIAGKTVQAADGTSRPMTVDDLAARPCTVRLNEGSGEVHRAFIAEEMPPELSDGESVAAIDVAANNTAALQEAKRRIVLLEGNQTAQWAALGFTPENNPAWVEISFADAWEEVPETVGQQTTAAVTLYRTNWETMKIEPYQAKQTALTQVPTGKTIKRYKAGVRLDEATGRLYRPRTASEFQSLTK